MSLKHYTCCIALLLSLFGCVGTLQERHSENWDELLERYPRERFLVAFGEGPSLAASQQQALLNLGQNFAVRIQGVQLTSSNLTSQRNGDAEEVTSSQMLSSNVRKNTDQFIQGSEVYPIEQIEALYRSLAVLEKARGRNILHTQIDDYDQRIAEALRQAGTLGPRRIETAGWLYQAIEFTNLREQRYQQLQVLDGAGQPPRASKAELQQRLARHMHGLPMTLRFAADVPEQHQQQMNSALINAGLHTTSNNADYSLAVKWSSQQPFARDGWFWQTAQLRIELVHLGSLLGEIVWDFKAAATQQDQLDGRMGARVNETLSTQAAARLVALASELS